MSKLYGGLTLQQIQDLPRNKMIRHIQEYVDPHFKSEAQTKREFEVEYSYVEADSIVVYADSEEEAEELWRVRLKNCRRDLHIESIKEIKKTEVDGVGYVEFYYEKE